MFICMFIIKALCTQQNLYLILNSKMHLIAETDSVPELSSYINFLTIVSNLPLQMLHLDDQQQRVLVR